MMAEETENFAEKFSKKINNVLIDPRIFTYKFICNCQGECCNFGVFTDLKEYETILEIKEKLLPLFDETQSKNIDKWFEPPEDDEDFENRRKVIIKVRDEDGEIRHVVLRGLEDLDHEHISEVLEEFCFNHDWEYLAHAIAVDNTVSHEMCPNCTSH